MADLFLFFIWIECKNSMKKTEVDDCFHKVLDLPISFIERQELDEKSKGSHQQVNT